MPTEKISIKNKPAIDSKSHSTNDAQNTKSKKSKQGFKNKLIKAGYSKKVADNIWNLYK
jgi:hypothetical protein